MWKKLWKWSKLGKKKVKNYAVKTQLFGFLLSKNFGLIFSKFPQL